MNYQEREALDALTNEVLPKVLEAGEKLGYWTAKPATVDGEGDLRWKWREVVTPDGLTFSISSGGWNKAGTISASVANLEGPGRRMVCPSDVRYSTSANYVPEAYSSVKRPPEVIAKDLYRRVVSTADAREVARKVLERVAELHANRAALLGHLEEVAKLGYRFAPDDSEAHAVKGHRTREDVPYTVNVTYTGRVDFEASTTVDRFGAVLAALGKPAF